MYFVVTCLLFSKILPQNVSRGMTTATELTNVQKCTLHDSRYFNQLNYVQVSGFIE